MRDPIVRKAFHHSVLYKEHGCSNTLVVDELGLNHGRIRADIAVLNGKLYGFEIKTDADNLNRLPNQIEAYNSVFDKNYIISGPKHISKIEQLIPKWWGIYLINDSDEQGIGFTLIRDAQQSPSQCSMSLAQLLWKEEALDIASKFSDIKVNRGLTKEKLYEILINGKTVSEIGKIVLSYLKTRSTWRIDPELSL